MQEKFPGIVKDATDMASLDEPKLKVLLEDPLEGSLPINKESETLQRARAVKMFEIAMELASGSRSKFENDNSHPVHSSWHPLVGKLVIFFSFLL